MGSQWMGDYEDIFEKMGMGVTGLLGIVVFDKSLAKEERGDGDFEGALGGGVSEEKDGGCESGRGVNFGIVGMCGSVVDCKHIVDVDDGYVNYQVHCCWHVAL